MRESGQQAFFARGGQSNQNAEVIPPAFDLHSVEEALMVNHRQFNGVALSRSEMQDAVLQYREFLRRHKALGMPEQCEAPGMLVDRVWHTHMCETRQYAKNCQEYFDAFLHLSSMTCEPPSSDGVLVT